MYSQLTPNPSTTTPTTSNPHHSNGTIIFYSSFILCSLQVNKASWLSEWQVFCSSQCLGHVTLCFLFFEKKKKRNRIIIPNMIILKTEVLPHFNLRPHFQTKGKYGATLHSTHSHRVNHLTQETQDPVTAGTLIFSWLHWCCGSPSNVIFSAVH